MQPPRLSKRHRWKLYSVALLLPIVISQLRTSSLVRAPSDDLFEVLLEHIGETRNKTAKTASIPNNDSTELDYRMFWQNAMEVALKSLEHEQNASIPSSRPCPKVFVYNLSSINRRDTIKKPAGFGMQVPLTSNHKLQGYLYKTNQYAFPSILLERIQSSKGCYTNDPNQADLFFAPILPAPKSVDMWNETCSHISGEIIRNSLHHLNHSNACRHFFAVGKGHLDVVGCDGWFSNPIPELQPFMRLAYSNYSFTTNVRGAHYYNDQDTTNITHPNLYSVPYPSNLHFRNNDTAVQQSLYTAKREILMSFMGKDDHGDVQVRKRIADFCKRHHQSCDYRRWKGKPDFVSAKAQATFCLEPAGDTPGRKSLSDSITFGCIPVLFSELTGDVAPWFWLDWKDRASIMVPRDDFVAGRIDLKKLLKSIPKDLLKLMKNTLKEKARQFQYSLDDDQEDGIRIVLDGLHRESLDRESRGACGR